MSAGNGKTILLVEDSELLLEMAEYELSQLGFTVVTAADLAAMRQRLAERTFDLVVADVELPGSSASELAEALKSVNSPVCLFSGLDEEALADRAAAVGASGYLRKQAGLDALAARVRALLIT